MKKLFKKENIFTLVFVIVALHPIIELDYLITDILPIPRLTTVIDFLILPLLVILAFWFNEKNKKKVGLLFGIYILIFGMYFLIHCRNANIIQGSIHLTDNFYFNIKDEIVYTLTLLIPLVYVYVFNLTEIGEKIIKRVTINCSYFILYLLVLLLIDFIGVINIHQAPRFSLVKIYTDNVIYYDTIFYDVVRCNGSNNNYTFKVIKNNKYRDKDFNDYCK